MSSKVLILGGTGMLGHTLFMQLVLQRDLDVYATGRGSPYLSRWFPKEAVERIRPDVDADNFDSVIRAFAAIQPDIVINCIGLVIIATEASKVSHMTIVIKKRSHRIVCCV